MWLWFEPNEEGREGGERKLIYVRHVFVGFVEGEESGIRNSEFGMRNSQPFSFCYFWKIIWHLQYFFVSLLLLF